MSPSGENASPKYRSPKLFLLLFRLELLVLVAILSAAGFAAAGVVNDTVVPWLFAVSAVAGEGFLLGWISRWFFRRFSLPLQWAAGLAATAVSLIVLGWLTRGLAGADPNIPIQSRPDWLGLVEILIGAITATLATVWGRIRYPPPAPKPADAGESGAKIKTGLPKESRPVRERIRNALRFFRRSKPDSEIRLVGSEEHKCPYCLQPIAARDPRGVVTCPICKTRHHKDCWDITGMCQVPHYHT
jgi:hypothetical protein